MIKFINELYIVLVGFWFYKCSNLVRKVRNINICPVQAPFFCIKKYVNYHISNTVDHIFDNFNSVIDLFLILFLEALFKAVKTAIKGGQHSSYPMGH